MPFGVKRDDVPIRDYPISEGVDPRISYGMAFAEWDAAKKSGLDLWRWENGEYPAWFMARVVAHNNITNLIKLHTDDAVVRASRLKARRQRSGSQG